jgi:putative ABC transport system permease protein
VIRHILRLLHQRRRHYRWLVAQLAVTFMVLVGGTVPVCDGQRALSKPAGFAPEDVLVLRTRDRRGLDRGHLPLLSSLWRVAGETPGVLAAALSTPAPSEDEEAPTTEYHGREPGDPIGALHLAVSPDYDRVMRVAPVAGRWLDRGACSGRNAEAVVTRDVADQMGGFQRAIGSRITPGGDGSSLQIVGVVERLKLRGPGYEPSSVVFTAFGAGRGGCDAPGPGQVMLRVSPGTGAAMRRTLIERLDRLLDGQLYDIAPMETRAVPSVVGIFFMVATLPLSALLAVTLVGVIWLEVQRRSSELGLRRALGARARTVRRQVLLELAALATKAALLGTLALVHLVFFGLGFLPVPHAVGDRLVLVARCLAVTPAALIVLLALVLAVAWLPSRLALRVTPVEALRND